MDIANVFKHTPLNKLLPQAGHPRSGSFMGPLTVGYVEEDRDEDELMNAPHLNVQGFNLADVEEQQLMYQKKAEL